MMQLLQVINYMMLHLEYTDNEIETMFKLIENKKMTLEDLLSNIGIEPWSPTIMENCKAKINKWPSALKVIKMRLEE